MERSIVNGLSVDVEDYFHASALDVPMDAWEAQDQRVMGNTVSLLEILAEADAKGTFFVLGWVAERYPKLVEAIAAGGHEVACHGYSHRLIYRQSPREFAEETRKAKDILENAAGAAVVGYRAASFSIVEKSLWALDIIAKLGFTYDSSIYPIYHDRYGIRGAPPRPHLVTGPAGSSLVEIPPSVVQFGPLRVPVTGGGYFRLYPYAFTRWAIRRINRSEHPAVVYLHPWEIDTNQPRANVGAITRFRHYVNIDKVRERLRRMLSEFRFEPMLAIADRYRAANLVTQVCDGARGATQPKAARS